MNTTVRTFVKPEGTVRMSNIAIDTKKKRFSMTLGFKAKGKRTFTEEPIEGTINQEVSDFFALKRKDHIKVVADNEQGFRWAPTGTTSTSFERFLEHKGMSFAAGVLASLVLECANDSDDRALNPFKIVRYSDRNMMTLVNVAPKKKTEIADPNTGEVTNYYSQKWYRDNNDRVKPSFLIPALYRRLVVETVAEVEAVQD